jgi:uncharacterized protein YutE (UPF0331/DUF86 family)
MAHERVPAGVADGNVARDSLTQESGKSLTPREKVFITDRALREKIDRMDSRLRALDPFMGISFSEFVKQVPGFERLMPLLAQSIVDISHSLLRRNTVKVPCSYFDIVASCARTGLFPPGLVKPIARQLLLIEGGGGSIDSAELLQIHRELPETRRTFESFLQRAREILEQSEPV